MEEKQTMQVKQAKRIQTSLLNGVERKVLVWMAERMPRWVTSDMLSGIGFVGALIIAAGYMLSDINGSLARVRQTQRPLYGFYLDHTLDVITEFIMFMGAGLSALLRLDIALLVFIAYLMLTLNVTINTHLKGEFRLTYAKLGPTEFRLIMIIVNTLLIYIRPLREFSTIWNIGSCSLTMSGLDIIALGIFALLLIIYVVTVFGDLRDYARRDPLPGRKD